MDILGSGNGSLRESKLSGAASALQEKIESHLADSQISYQAHLAFAVRASARLAYASIASIVHAFVPALFPSTAARIVISLYKERLEHHPNPRYQAMLRGDAALGAPADAE